MSQYNIGPRIGIEGEAQFRAQVNRINSEYRSMDSYLQTLDRSMAQNGKSQEALATKSNVLRQQLALQEQRFDALSDALSKAQEKYGANSQEVMRYEGAILDVQTTQAKLTRELADTEDEMRRLAEGIEDAGDSAEDAGPQMLSFGDIVKAGIASGAILGTLEQVGEAIVDIGSQAIEAAADVKAANAQFEQTFSGLEGPAKAALRAVSNETGIAATRLQNGYTALYAFTKSVGGDSATSLDIAQRALKAAADSAAYYDRSVEDATETLMSFVKGNYANDAALGIAATETTRNAKANELYAKSFKELTEAQKVDVLLSMVEAGNKASGALGQAAREADSWVNVTGELSEAWKQLLAQLGGPILPRMVPLIQGITDALKGWTEQASWDQLNQSVSDFHAGLDSAAESLTKSSTEMNTTAALAQRYVDRLRELEGAGLDTAETQREYAQVVNLLNEIMPELGLTINEVTGRLEQNTWAIEQNIQSLRDQAVQQAKMAYYKSIIDEYAKAYEAQFAAEQRLLQLQTEEAIVQQQLFDAEQMRMAANIRGDADLTRRTEKVLDLTNALDDNRKEQVKLNEAIAESSAALAENEGKLADAEAGYAELAGDIDTATAAMDEQTESVDALAEAYNASKIAARESIDSQIGLFDELASKNEWSAKKIIKNWQDQQKAFSNYADNLKKAVDLGLDETLIAQLSDGSQQSMQILHALVNDTKIGVDEINAAFGERLKVEDYLTSTMADMESIMSDSFDQMVKYAEAAGLDIVNGASGSIIKNIGQYENALKRLASRGQQAYRHEWDINSPSRVMESMTDNIPDAAVLTLERRTPDYERAMANFGAAGVAAYQDQLDHVSQYPSMMQGVPGYDTSTTTNTRNVAYGGISININTQPGQDAHSIADAVLEELTVRLGQEEGAF